MKYTAIISCFLCGALCLVFSCSEVEKLLTFTIGDQTTFRVESTAPLPLEIATPDVTTNSSEKFENNNTAANLVKNVKLQEVRLTISNPPGKTFSFLKSVNLFISTSQSNALPRASIDNIPAGVSTVTMITTDAKLDEYVKASSYKLRTSVVTRETLSSAVDITVDLSFKVTAAPL
jgi:hypothetical protein